MHNESRKDICIEKPFTTDKGVSVIAIPGTNVKPCLRFYMRLFKHQQKDL